MSLQQLVHLRWVPEWASQAGKWDSREIWKWDLREIICSSREICEDIKSVAEKGVANEAMGEEDLLELVGWLNVISILLYTFFIQYHIMLTQFFSS